MVVVTDWRDLVIVGESSEALDDDGGVVANRYLPVMTLRCAIFCPLGSHLLLLSPCGGRNLDQLTPSLFRTTRFICTVVSVSALVTERERPSYCWLEDELSWPIRLRFGVEQSLLLKHDMDTV